MANRTFNNVQSLDREIKTLHGVVTFGASGAVSSVDALGFTVSKPAATTGIYRVTFEDKFSACLGAIPVLYNAGTAAAAMVQIHDEYDSSADTLDLVHLAESASDFAAADATEGHKLYITLVMRNTSVPRKGV